MSSTGATTDSGGTGGGAPPVARCLHNADYGDIAEHLKDQTFFWLDLEGPDDGYVKKLGEQLKLHPLTIEDLMTFGQRPKREEFGTYTQLVVYGVDVETESGGHLLVEVHLVITGAYVITIHRRPFAVLDEVRKRYDSQPTRSEQYLIYKVLDAVIGTYVPVLSRVDDDIDDIEQAVIEKPEEESLQRIFSLKRDLIGMRRVVTPMRDFFARDEERIAHLPGMQDDDRLYFRDLYDSLIRVSDLVDSYRDLLSGATDMYLSQVANRQGEVNKQLTIIATIFLPLTFLTGFFGQNFAFLTNHIQQSLLSFIVLGLGLLVVSIIGFWVFFRRKRWI